MNVNHSRQVDYPADNPNNNSMVMTGWRTDKRNTIINQPPLQTEDRRTRGLLLRPSSKYAHQNENGIPDSDSHRRRHLNNRLFLSHSRYHHSGLLVVTFLGVFVLLNFVSYVEGIERVGATPSTTTTTTAAKSTITAGRKLFNPNRDQMGPNIFAECAGASTSVTDGTLNQTALMQCISDTFQEQESARNQDLQSFLFVVAGAMIFFMQAGFAMLCAGSVRIKNVQNTMLKNLLDACGAAIAFFLVGYAFAFGGQSSRSGTTFIGSSEFLTLGSSAAFWFFEYTFSATSVTIVAGTLAERCQMAAYLCYSVFLVGFVYPVVAHCLWSNNGFLSVTHVDPFFGIGSVDFAGSGVVHVTGGTTALYATLILGPRRGRFFDAQGEPLDTPKEFPGHSVALQLLGTMILWFGWFGFNPGSALLLEVDNVGKNAAQAAVSTALAGAAGGVTALFTNLYLVERRTGEASFSIVMCMNGSLGGLVAITSGCAVVEPWAAVVIGICSGWVYMYTSSLLIRCRIDDAVDAIPVHMFNGMWGMIATGFFAAPRLMQDAYATDAHVGWFYSLGRGSFDAALLLNQFVAVVFIVGWTFFTMMPFFIWLNYMGWLRADSLEELVGLDISYHGGTTGGEKEGVKKEYVEAYKRHKGTIRSRRHLNGASSSGVGTANTRWHSTGNESQASDFDPERHQEAAAEEAMIEEIPMD